MPTSSSGVNLTRYTCIDNHKFYTHLYVCVCNCVQMYDARCNIYKTIILYVEPILSTNMYYITQVMCHSIQSKFILVQSYIVMGCLIISIIL